MISAGLINSDKVAKMVNSISDSGIEFHSRMVRVKKKKLDM